VGLMVNVEVPEPLMVEALSEEVIPVGLETLR
jgi:hypothetical protein